MITICQLKFNNKNCLSDNMSTVWVPLTITFRTMQIDNSDTPELINNLQSNEVLLLFTQFSSICCKNASCGISSVSHLSNFLQLVLVKLTQEIMWHVWKRGTSPPGDSVEDIAIHYVFNKSQNIFLCRAHRVPSWWFLDTGCLIISIEGDIGCLNTLTNTGNAFVRNLHSVTK